MLPIGLAHGIRLTRDVAAGSVVTEDEVDLDPNRLAVRIRREMCSRHGIRDDGTDLRD
jgi:predicted homoserine dehydrogenase-like protein